MHGSGGACVAVGACVAGEEACVVGGDSVCGRGCAWWGHVWQGGMHGGGVHGLGDMHGKGHAWQGVCMAGGRQGAWQGGMCGRYYEIRSMSRQYASYWNAFLLVIFVLCLKFGKTTIGFSSFEFKSRLIKLGLYTKNKKFQYSNSQSTDCQSGVITITSKSQL